MKHHNEESFFITEEVEAGLIATVHVFELPPIVCAGRLYDVLESMTDAKLALQPGEIADQERKHLQKKPCSTS
ncbi:hypothetical protein [Serratia marcescens]|uniref:hypothetical protein n=1 Tax=Serratia marcescens TaxID=615 RepID=UPI00402B8CB0